MRPGWLTPRAGLTAALAAVGAVASGLQLSGGWKAAPIAVLALLAVASVVQEHQERAKQAADDIRRSRLDVQVVPVPDSLQRSADVDVFVDQWTADERQICLQSVEPKPRGRPTLDLDALKPPNGEPGLTFAEIEDLERRFAAGEILSADEQRQYDAAKRTLKAAGVSASLAASRSLEGLLGKFSSPEDRTPDQYRQQVEAYLREVGEMLPAVARWHEVDRGLASLEFQVTNTTDRNYSGVEVEIYMPGALKGVDPAEVPELPGPWARPRAFGTRKPTSLGRGVSPLMLPTFTPPRTRFGPIIDNGGSVKVTHRPVDLRPGEMARQTLST